MWNLFFHSPNNWFLLECLMSTFLPLVILWVPNFLQCHLNFYLGACSCHMLLSPDSFVCGSYINFSLSAFYYFTIQHERESKKMKRENHQNVRELTVQLEDWDRGWTDALENGKHWLPCIPLRSMFISECSHMAARQSLTCPNHPRRTSQWPLSLRNINMNPTCEGRTPKNKEGQESLLS